MNLHTAMELTRQHCQAMGYRMEQLHEHYIDGLTIEDRYGQPWPCAATVLWRYEDDAGERVPAIVRVECDEDVSVTDALRAEVERQFWRDWEKGEVWP